MYMFYPHLIPKEPEIALGDILAYTIRAQALLSEWLPAYTVSCPVQGWSCLRLQNQWFS